MKFDRKTAVSYWTVLKDSIVKFVDDDYRRMPRPCPST